MTTQTDLQHPHWYLLQCKTQQHRRALENLANQSFSVYSPEHKVRRIVRRQMQTRIEPLFPGYVFIQLNQHSDWRALQSTRGVTRVVSFNGMPQVVPEALVHALQQKFCDQDKPAPLFKAGEKVMVTEGCFRHVEAIVKAVTPDERIIVLLNILHTEQAVPMPATYLRKVG